MKVAILLTGQMRTFEMLKYLHMNSLILKYDADVFLGIDPNNKYQLFGRNSREQTGLDQIKEAVDFFKPKDTFVLDKYDYLENSFWDHLILRQYYVVKKTYEMLKKYSDNNNIKYDMVIRLRFDLLISSEEVPIPPKLLYNETKDIIYNKENIEILKEYSLDKKFIFEEISDDTMYVINFGDFDNHQYANDYFFYHTHSLIQKMIDFYDNMIPIRDYCIEKKFGTKGATMECIFYLYITHFNNINLKKINGIKGEVVRESLIRN